MIRVMIVDDSPLVRKIAGDILSSELDIQVVATASTAEFALGKLDREAPDVITMDMEMPGMGGVAAIRRIMERRPTPIIVLSSHARRGADLTLQALEAGALDFVLKPSASLSGGLDAVAVELREKVRSAARSTVSEAKAPAEARHGIAREDAASRGTAEHGVIEGAGASQEAAWRGFAPAGTSVLPFDLIAIGTSTGGPVALKTVLAGLPADLPLPIAVVQHMPPVFTKAFADRLNATCEIAVKEAEEGDLLTPGKVLIAPGDFHMTVTRSGRALCVHLDRSDPVSGHRPSVDVLMGSVARELGSRAVGVIMTGMGKDGANGIVELHRRGGVIIAQDKESSVIFGMNREVIMNGDADAVVPVDRIAAALRELTRSASRN